MKIDRDAWSGDGDFTVALLDALATLDDHIVVIKVQDAPTSASGTGYNYLANDVFVGFRIERALALSWALGIVPLPGVVHRKTLTLEGLSRLLEATEGIGAPDYADGSMLQYLRAERVPAPYQARGPKVVEVVRIFEATPLGQMPE